MGETEGQRKVSYIYVLPTPNFTKFGRTRSPINRLYQHRMKFGKECEYAAVWEVGQHDVSIEAQIKNDFHSYGGETKERLYVDQETLIKGIDDIVQKIDAAIVRIDLSNLEASAPNNDKFPFKNLITLTESQRDKLDKLADLFEESANAIVRRALLDLYRRSFPNEK